MREMLALAAALSAATVADAADPSPRTVVQASLAAISRHDAAGLAALYADDAVVIASDSCKPSIGPAAVKTGHEALVKAMPDLTIEATDWVVEGDRVAVMLTARSKALGSAGTMTLADFFTVRYGKIVRDVTIFNPGSPCR